MTRIYKILSEAEWREASAKGSFEGSSIDLTDGFIHFSTADQVEETARRHFAGKADLVMLVVDAGALGEALRWEPSRGGALFPHLYRAPDCSHVIEARPAPLRADGVPDVGGAGS